MAIFTLPLALRGVWSADIIFSLPVQVVQVSIRIRVVSPCEDEPLGMSYACNTYTASHSGLQELRQYCGSKYPNRAVEILPTNPVRSIDVRHDVEGPVPSRSNSSTFVFPPLGLLAPSPP